MGASAWCYVVSYDADPRRSLAALREQVFAAREYHFLGDDWPGTLPELFADEDVQETGTHSILDVSRIVDADQPDTFGTVRPLRPAELQRFFGTERPTETEFESAYDAAGTSELKDHGIRGSGYCTTLYSGGDPTAIAFWGRSGD
jgi:hypothetical protein